MQEARSRSSKPVERKPSEWLDGLGKSQRTLARAVNRQTPTDKPETRGMGDQGEVEKLA